MRPPTPLYLEHRACPTITRSSPRLTYGRLRSVDQMGLITLKRRSPSVEAMTIAARGIVLENQHSRDVASDYPSPNGEVREKATDRRSRERKVAARSLVDVACRCSQQSSHVVHSSARSMAGTRISLSSPTADIRQ